jgi:hypothetical protein
VSITSIVYARLKNDPTLVGTISGGGQYTGILRGGIWDRPLKREGAARTPEAFYVTEFGKLNRTAGVVLDGGRNPHRQVESIPHASWSFPRVVLYAQATAGGKAAIEQAFSRIYDLLHHWRTPIPETPNTTVVFEFADSTPVLDSEEFIGAVSTVVRYQATYRYRSGE